MVEQSVTYKQLHVLEDHLIEINGLIRALQKVLPDGDAHVCIANALEDGSEHFQEQFYLHWDSITR